MANNDLTAPDPYQSTGITPGVSAINTTTAAVENPYSSTPLPNANNPIQTYVDGSTDPAVPVSTGPDLYAQDFAQIPAIYSRANVFVTQVQENVTQHTTVVQGGDYGNANVSAFLATNTGNIAAGYFLGDGSELTGISALGNFIVNGSSRVDVVTPGGNVIVSADGAAWSFGTDGTLTTPGISGNITGANVIQANTIAGNGNLKIQPDPNTDGAYLDVYLTGGPDIHIAGNGETVIIGRDEGANVSVQASGNVAIQANAYISGTPHHWNFGTDGNLTLPDGTVLQNGGGIKYPVSPEYEWDLHSSDNKVYIGSVDNMAYIDTYDANISVRLRANENDWIFGADGNLTLPSNTFAVNYANGTPVTLGAPAGNSGAAQFNWQGTFSNQGGTPGDTYSTLQFDSNGMPTLNGTTAYQQRVDNSPYLQILAPRVESTDFGIVAGPALTVVGYDDTYNTPRSAYFSMQDQATATQQWDFGILGNGNNNFVISDRTNSNQWDFGTDGTLTLPGSIHAREGNDLNLVVYNPTVESTLGGVTFSVQNRDVESGHKTTQFDVGPADIVLTTDFSGTKNEWTFGADGTTTFPGNLTGNGASPALSISGFASANFASNVTANTFIGNGSQLAGVATSTASSWTLVPGTNTVNFSVPLSGTYSIWVRGNIPNGIVTYTATAVVTNTNVPVLGSQYGWYYLAGNALVLTAIPTQFVGTPGEISNAAPYSGNTANVFEFGITNNSGANAVVNWGYTKL